MERNSLIDQILFEYKETLGRDFCKYRNHVYRVYSLCLILDGTPQNEEKYAIASAFHDLGIWTSNTFDYLDPSIALANDWLVRQAKSELLPEISTMINMHHKISKYTGQFTKSCENFRKADWIDVSHGILKFEASSRQLQTLTKKFPTIGFHRFLIKITVKNLFKNPFNPLPMFKK